MSGDCGSGCGPGYGGRRFYTREEKKMWLEDYAQALEAEAKAVRERIQDLGGRSA